jgi:hypothetical protein
MANAIERIVVQATAQDKQAIAAKAKMLELPRLGTDAPRCV